MAEELQNVIEVIDDLKASNIVNVQILKKALSDINLKLEDIYEGEELIFIRNSLADFKNTLENKFDNIFERLESLKNDTENDEIAQENADLLQDKFKSLFSIFDSSVKLLSSKVDDIETNISKITESNLDVTKEEFSKISEELKVHQREILETNKASDENTIERFSFVAESIKLLSENINIQTDMYKNFIEKQTAEISEFINKNESALVENNTLVKTELAERFKQIEDANSDFVESLEGIKTSISEFWTKTEELSQVTSDNFTIELNSVKSVIHETISEIKILQDFAGSLVESTSKIIEYTENNRNEGILEAIKELDISKNISDLFEKVDIFNNNFNIKTEFLEEQIFQIKTMFSDFSIDIQNREAEFLQHETQRVQEYYGKIEKVSESIFNLEESLKLSGVEYKEHISTLNQELTNFIAEFNTIYNELAGSTQLELTNSLEELKQFISVNSNNYNDKLVIIQEQFAQTFRELFEVVKTTSNYELIDTGIREAKEVVAEHNRLLESIGAKLDAMASNDLTSEVVTQNEQTQELVKILNTKVDSLLNFDFNTVPEAQMLVNKNLLEAFAALKEQANHLTALAEQPIDNTEILELNQKILALINQVDTKLDILATTDYEPNFDEILDSIDETKEFIEKLESKVDSINFDDKFEKLENKVDSINYDDKFEKLESKVDSINFDDSFEKLEEKVDSINFNIEFDNIAEKIDTLNFDKKFEEVSEKVATNKDLINALHTKLDIFVSTSDNDLLEDELQEIKDIILEQQEILSHSSNDEENAQINENISKLLTRIDGISDTINEHDENSLKIKEDLVNTIVSVFSSANFVEESEDIKDFVEEKTDELSKQLIDVKSQIETMKQNDVSDYSYTLADVENDIAKLRQAMKDISVANPAPSQEFNQISRNIHNLTSSIDAISKNLTPAEIYQLKHNIYKLNDDILSISSRTNKLLLNSDESQKTIAEGLEAFGHIAYNLEERMNELSNKEFNQEIVDKLGKLILLGENSASMNATFHKVLMFLGEWVDAASDSIEKINDKTDEIENISEAFSELRKVVPEKFALIELLEERFEEQQSRMDRLEAKLDELTEIAKVNSNLSIVQKVDKMERMLETLNVNIEKLTSYVD